MGDDEYELVRAFEMAVAASEDARRAVHAANARLEMCLRAEIIADRDLLAYRLKRELTND